MINLQLLIDFLGNNFERFERSSWTSPPPPPHTSPTFFRFLCFWFDVKIKLSIQRRTLISRVWLSHWSVGPLPRALVFKRSQNVILKIDFNYCYLINKLRKKIYPVTNKFLKKQNLVKCYCKIAIYYNFFSSSWKL